MKDFFYKCFMVLSLTFSLSANGAAAETQYVRLANHVPERVVSHATLVNSLDADKNVNLTFTLPLRNQEELIQLIDRIYDPADQEYYGKYLTSKEFIERFAPTEQDYNQVIAYVKSLGLTVHDQHPNRLLLNVGGVAKSVESAFNLTLHEYLLPDGRKFHAPNDNPEIPQAVASVISGIVGLDNHAVWRPFYRLKQTAEIESLTSTRAFPSGPGGGFAPKDIVKAYNLTSVVADGSGQIIALFELGGYKTSDINAYTQHFGLPAAQLKNILVNGGSTSGIDPEVTLDIELALALAPKSQIYVYEGPNSNQGVLNTYNKIAVDNLAKQVSTSWGLGENLVNAQYLHAENAIFQQMAAQGQTIYAAAGDSGAYDDYPNNSSHALVVDDPASQPYVVGVGGTTLSVKSTTGTYVGESVWNDGLGNGAGGGGVSTVWPIPSWQTNISSLHSDSYRNIPDVALNADTNTGYAIYYNGQWQIYGGTSCAAPLWAAFTALVNQNLVAAKKSTLGFANPIFYAIGKGSSYTSNFHDVTKGNNLYYSAQKGCDNASGWGSFNGANLFKTLTNPTPISAFHAPIMMSNLSFANQTSSR